MSVTPNLLHVFTSRYLKMALFSKKIHARKSLHRDSMVKLVGHFPLVSSIFRLTLLDLRYKLRVTPTQTLFKCVAFRQQIPCKSF